MIRISTLAAIFFTGCLLATAQTPKTFTKDNLSFDYPEGWTVEDASTGDAHQFSVGKPNSDVQIRIFVHKGRISQEKLADAKKAFIDPYIAATVKPTSETIWIREQRMLTRSGPI